MRTGALPDRRAVMAVVQQGSLQPSQTYRGETLTVTAEFELAWYLLRAELATRTNGDHPGRAAKSAEWGRLQASQVAVYNNSCSAARAESLQLRQEWD